jgi:hypothetical protein
VEKVTLTLEISCAAIHLQFGDQTVIVTAFMCMKPLTNEQAQSIWLKNSMAHSLFLIVYIPLFNGGDQ